MSFSSQFIIILLNSIVWNSIFDIVSVHNCLTKMYINIVNMNTLTMK